jgi:hypothetical protein
MVGLAARRLGLPNQCCCPVADRETAAEVAAITGVKERQVQHWVAGTHRPTGAKRDRLLELAYIVERLSDVYRPEGIDIWIHGRNRDLGGQRPIDLLRQGDFAAVLNAVERLETGAAGQAEGAS